MIFVSVITILPYQRQNASGASFNHSRYPADGLRCLDSICFVIRLKRERHQGFCNPAPCPYRIRCGAGNNSKPARCRWSGKPFDDQDSPLGPDRTSELSYNPCPDERQDEDAEVCSCLSIRLRHRTYDSPVQRLYPIRWILSCLVGMGRGHESRQLVLLSISCLPDIGGAGACRNPVHDQPANGELPCTEARSRHSGKLYLGRHFRHRAILHPFMVQVPDGHIPRLRRQPGDVPDRNRDTEIPS